MDRSSHQGPSDDLGSVFGCSFLHGSARSFHEARWTVRIWDVATGEELWKLEGHPAGVESVAFHPNGTHIASMSATNWAVWIWTLDTDELIEIAESRVTRRMTDLECEVYLNVETCLVDR